MTSASFRSVEADVDDLYILSFCGGGCVEPIHRVVLVRRLCMTYTSCRSVEEAVYNLYILSFCGGGCG